MSKISAPGIYDLSMEEYHGQITDGWSFSSSDAQVVAGLEPLTPAHLRTAWAKPRKRERKADFGTALHCMVLEPFRTASQIVVIDDVEFRKDATKKAADDALAAGKTPLLAGDYARARHVAEILLNHPRAAKWFAAGIAEQSFIAKEARAGIYLKARPDWYTRDRVILDVKTVASTSDQFLKNRITSGHWFMQAPWYCDVVERVDGEQPENFFWVCIEQDEPHAIRFIEPTAGTMAAGARENAKAIAIFAECARTNLWPAYPDKIETDLGLNDFAHFRLEEAALAPARGMEAARLGADLNASPFA